ncbi:MAG: S41 family peptidase [Anaerolineales bacterium]|jgi:carboxyl-terminal processing protease
MKSQRKNFLVTTIVVLVLCLDFVGGAWTEHKTLFLGGGVPPEANQNIGLIEKAWSIIENNYVDQASVKPTQMTYGAISGMVDSLGDTGHSIFLSPEMVKEEQNFTQGQFEGVGLEIQIKEGKIVIVAPIDGSPAQKAGLNPGDIILKVNSVNVSGLSVAQVANRVLGPAGTQVILTIQDPKTGESREVTIQRARINLQNVTWHMLPGTTIAHLRLAGFSQGVTQDLQQALQEIRTQGATGLILDLRNDPGGLLNEAVGVTSQFLSGGNVLLEKNAKGELKSIPVESGGIAPMIPIVVLINGGTSSAAEIVSGALQDAHRAELVGETTFGTGTVLNEFPLSDGSALSLAIEEWLTPNGGSIWHHGISPDIQVSLPENTTPLVPEAEQDLTKTQLTASGDNQLLRALDILDQTSRS